MNTSERERPLCNLVLIIVVSQLKVIIMATSTDNVASFCGVPYLKFSVPAAYANYQQEAKRKCTESRILPPYGYNNFNKVGKQSII